MSLHFLYYSTAQVVYPDEIGVWPSGCFSHAGWLEMVGFQGWGMTPNSWRTFSNGYFVVVHLPAGIHLWFCYRGCVPLHLAVVTELSAQFCASRCSFQQASITRLRCFSWPPRKLRALFHHIFGTTSSPIPFPSSKARAAFSGFSSYVYRRRLLTPVASSLPPSTYKLGLLSIIQ